MNTFTLWTTRTDTGASENYNFMHIWVFLCIYFTTNLSVVTVFFVLSRVWRHHLQPHVSNDTIIVENVQHAFLLMLLSVVQKILTVSWIFSAWNIHGARFWCYSCKHWRHGKLCQMCPKLRISVDTEMVILCSKHISTIMPFHNNLVMTSLWRHTMSLNTSTPKIPGFRALK